MQPPKMRYRAYLLLKLEAPKQGGQCPALPRVTQVMIASQPATSMSIGLWSVLMSMEGASFKEAQDRLKEYAFRALPWTRPWLEDGMEAHMRRYGMKPSPTF